MTPAEKTDRARVAALRRHRPNDPKTHELAAAFKADRLAQHIRRKPRKYEAPAGRTAVLDVHPFNVGRLSDPAVDLWVTEGLKKGDALTSADECAVALAGVWNWRNKQGPLGDWESVQLRGRIVYVCFDSDTRTNPSVRGAMRRLGQFLTSKGAIVRYVVPPSVVGDAAKVGVDDYLNNGGTVTELKAMATRRPLSDPVDGSATDAVMAQRVSTRPCVVSTGTCLLWVGWPMTVPVGVRSARRWWSRRCGVTSSSSVPTRLKTGLTARSRRICCSCSPPHG